METSVVEPVVGEKAPDLSIPVGLPSKKGKPFLTGTLLKKHRKAAKKQRKLERSMRRKS